MSWDWLTCSMPPRNVFTARSRTTHPGRKCTWVSKSYKREMFIYITGFMLARIAKSRTGFGSLGVSNLHASKQLYGLPKSRLHPHRTCRSHAPSPLRDCVHEQCAALHCLRRLAKMSEFCTARYSFLATRCQEMRLSIHRPALRPNAYLHIGPVRAGMRPAPLCGGKGVGILLHPILKGI